MVVAEQRQGTVRDVTLENIALASSLAGGGRVTVLLLGKGIKAAAEGLLKSGADEIIAVEGPALEYYTYDCFSEVIETHVRKLRPELIISGYTSLGMDLFPGIAVSLGWPHMADCMNVRVEGGRIRAVRQMYGGKIEADISAPLPGVITVRPGSVRAVAAEKEGVLQFVEYTPGSRPRTEAGGYSNPPKEDVEIEKAKIIVAVGRGIEKKENLPLFEELASLIGGAVLAGSRPIIDNGWLPKGRQVGVSGKTVKPKLYLAIGISGAIQHLTGMSDSELIVAINKDREAPIFKVADIGIQDDLFKIVPALIRELKK